MHVGKKETLYNKDKKRICGKSKPTAVVLAVIFSIWAWLYTAREDWGKFAFGLALIIFMSFLGAIFMWTASIIIYILVIIDTAKKPVMWYTNYYS